MFYVIEFNDDTCEVAPEKWISSDGSYCYWPPLRYGALAEAIRSEKTPEQNWKRIEIKTIKRKCATYEIADKKANKFTRTSDLSSVTTEAETEVCSNTKRIKRPPASYSPELPGNSRVQQKIRSAAKKSKTPSALQQLPTIPPGLALSRSPERSISSLVTETNQENDAGFGLANEDNENSDRESQFSSSLISQTTPSTSSMLVAHRESVPLRRQEFELLLNKLNRMDGKLDVLARKVTLIFNKSGAGGNSDVPSVPDGMLLPCNTTKDLRTVSSIIQHSTRVGRNLARYLSTFCSTSVTMSVNAMMKALMTNTLSLEYNWTGSHQKHNFMRLNIAPVICDAVRMNEALAGTVNKTVEDKIKVWLRQASDRDGGRRRRFLKSIARDSRSSFTDLPTDRESDDSEGGESEAVIGSVELENVNE